MGDLGRTLGRQIEKMEFNFTVTRALRVNSEGIAVLRPSQSFPSHRELTEIINRMGQLSAHAQGLPGPITTASKFFNSPDNVLYIKIAGEKVVGFIKTGVRRLFHFSEVGVRELQPLCLLDFYVHESLQRSGFGKELYEFMLQDAQIQPAKIAIDRPSQKLLSFMRKHYGLSQYLPQSNNYVIYSQYFESLQAPERKNRGVGIKEESKIRAIGMMVLGGSEARPGTKALPAYPRPIQRDTSARGALRPPWGTSEDLPNYIRPDWPSFRPLGR